MQQPNKMFGQADAMSKAAQLLSPMPSTPSTVPLVAPSTTSPEVVKNGNQPIPTTPAVTVPPPAAATISESTKVSVPTAMPASTTVSSDQSTPTTSTTQTESTPQLQEPVVKKQRLVNEEELAARNHLAGQLRAQVLRQFPQFNVNERQIAQLAQHLAAMQEAARERADTPAAATTSTPLQPSLVQQQPQVAAPAPAPEPIKDAAPSQDSTP